MSYRIDIEDYKGRWKPAWIAAHGEAKGLDFKGMMQGVALWIQSSPYTYTRTLKVTNEKTGSELFTIPLKEESVS